MAIRGNQWQSACNSDLDDERRRTCSSSNLSFVSSSEAIRGTHLLLEQSEFRLAVVLVVTPAPLRLLQLTRLGTQLVRRALRAVLGLRRERRQLRARFGQLDRLCLDGRLECGHLLRQLRIEKLPSHAVRRRRTRRREHLVLVGRQRRLPHAIVGAVAATRGLVRRRRMVRQGRGGIVDGLLQLLDLAARRARAVVGAVLALVLLVRLGAQYDARHRGRLRRSFLRRRSLGKEELLLVLLLPLDGLVLDQREARARLGALQLREPRTCGNQWQSVAISDNQWPCVAISGTQ